MIAEIALALLVLAVFASLALVWNGASGIVQSSDAQHIRVAKRAAIALFSLVTIAFLLLIYCYATSDFSVVNVYENSHTAKPFIYKITGTWGNHEGSMLLWVWVLTLFTAAYAVNTKESIAYAPSLRVLGVVSLGFLLFILFTSNPFERLIDVPIEGRDLNPLLQDIGLAMHPPLLYLGYVGFAIVFAIAVGALLAKQEIGAEWAQHVRPWALLAWAFLTAGIGLGSWWAYRELGWGGWWFWDPVENVSLLPWLAGTALIHCLLVLSKRPVLQNWTLLLAIFTFTCSLLGTFLVRSGLLTSVHSFASDPTRGLYVLAFIGVITGGSLWIYALRYPRPTAPDFLPLSREGGVLLNNLLLLTLCATVMLGIIYPLLMQVFNMPSVSVGAPYYNTVVVPVSLPLLVAAGLTPFLAWKQAKWRASRRMIKHAFFASALASVFAVILQWHSLPHLFALPIAAIAAACGVFMLGATISYGLRLHRSGSLTSTAPVGMLLAHAGLAVFVTAAAFASAGRIEIEQQLAVGSKMIVDGYEVQLASLTQEQKLNYIRHQAVVHFSATDNSEAFTLYPETRFYPTRAMETAESSIHNGFGRDVYTAIATNANLRNINDYNNIIVLRVYLIPAIQWVWLGFAMTSLGGLIAAMGYFHAQRRAQNRNYNR
jgi:cytochrome c-type biogenesis protein CcmF